jgi:hypothetical protein
MASLTAAIKYLLASHVPHCADLVCSRVTPTPEGAYPVSEIIQALMHAGVETGRYIHLARSGWTHVRFMIDLPSPQPSYVH